MRNSFLTSIISPAMRYLKISSPEPSELDKTKALRKYISEKLVLSSEDRRCLKQLDETIQMLQKQK